MAKMGCASICLLLVLATFAQCSLAARFPVQGTVRVFNNAAFTIEHTATYSHDGGSFREPGTVIFPGNVMKYNINQGVTCVESTYSGVGQTLSKTILDWCHKIMPIDCLPDCFWIVDNKGFRVAGIDRTLLEYVTDW